MPRVNLAKMGMVLSIFVLLSAISQAGMLYLEPAYPEEVYGQLNDIITYDLIFNPGVDDVFFLIAFDYDFGFDNLELEYVSTSSSLIPIDDLMSGEVSPGELWLVGMDLSGGHQFLVDTPETVLSIDFRVIASDPGGWQSDCWVLEQDPALYKGMMDNLGGMHSFGAAYGANIIVPEPGMFSLLILGIAGTVLKRKCKR